MTTTQFRNVAIVAHVDHGKPPLSTACWSSPAHSVTTATSLGCTRRAGPAPLRPSFLPSRRSSTAPVVTPRLSDPLPDGSRTKRMARNPSIRTAAARRGGRDGDDPHQDPGSATVLSLAIPAPLRLRLAHLDQDQADLERAPDLSFIRRPRSPTTPARLSS